MSTAEERSSPAPADNRISRWEHLSLCGAVSLDGIPEPETAKGEEFGSEASATDQAQAGPFSLASALAAKERGERERLKEALNLWRLNSCRLKSHSVNK